MENRIEPLLLRPAFSRMLTIWLLALHLPGLLVLWQLQMPWLIKLSLGLLQMFYLYWQIRRHLLRNTPQAIREVRLDADGAWWLITHSGARLRAELLPDSFVKPWLLVLNFRTGSRVFTRSIILPSDSLDPDLARRLRIHLLQFERLAPRGQAT